MARGGRIGSRDPFVRLLAPHVGSGRWLSFSLLRVQAFLELPFTMFAYLAVARLYGHRLYLGLARLPVMLAVGISFSLTFSIIELRLPNPYTHDDLWLRALSALVTPVYIAWTARHAPEAPDGPRGTLGILAALAGAGGIAYFVLAIYDAFLLYNLAHLGLYAVGLPIAIAIAAVASYAAPRLGKASPGNDAILATLRAFTVIFFVPSLAIRYSGALDAGFVLTVAAVLYGFVTSKDPLRLLLTSPFAAAAGVTAAYFATRDLSPDLPELVLAVAAVSFLVVTIVLLRGMEVVLCWGAHETKAAADEA